MSLEGQASSEGAASDAIILRRIASLLRPYRRLIGWLWITTLLEAAAGAMNPFIYKVVVNAAIQGRVDVIEVMAGVLAVLALVSAALSVMTRWLSSRMVENFGAKLRENMFLCVNRMSMSFFLRAPKGDLLSRFNAEAMGAEQSVLGIVSDAASQVMTVIFAICGMLLLSPSITGLSLVLAPIFVFPANRIGRRLRALAEERYEQIALMNQFVVERFSVSGAILTKTLGWPDADEARFSRHARQVASLGVAQSLYARSLYVALTLLAAMATVLVYGMGGVLAAYHHIEIGSVVALAAYLNRLYGPLTSLSNVRVDLLSGLASFRRIFDVLDLRPDVADRPGSVALAESMRPVPMLELSGVAFRYPVCEGEVSSRSDRDGASCWTVDGISFSVERGQTVGIVGPSGCGKSTIAALICRHYDVAQGAVFINGMDVRAVTLASLRRSVSLITQNVHMFHETIRENLVLANPSAGDALMWEALSVARLDSLVRLMPAGLDTVVGDSGLRLSGGEQQRFAIARLALREPSVVILDEPTAHLDASSEALMQDSLRSLLAGRTTLVIAHRLATVREADLIVVLENGRVVDMGDHDDLLTRPGYYSDAYGRLLGDRKR